MNFRLGDRVIITKLSNASLNLYQKEKMKGMSFLRCPCNVKTGDEIRIESQLRQGFLIRNVTKNWLTVAHPKDLRIVE